MIYIAHFHRKIKSEYAKKGNLSDNELKKKTEFKKKSSKNNKIFH